MLPKHKRRKFVYSHGEIDLSVAFNQFFRCIISRNSGIIDHNVVITCKGPSAKDTGVEGRAGKEKERGIDSRKFFDTGYGGSFEYWVS